MGAAVGAAVGVSIVVVVVLVYVFVVLVGAAVAVVGMVVVLLDVDPLRASILSYLCIASLYRGASALASARTVNACKL